MIMDIKSRKFKLRIAETKLASKPPKEDIATFSKISKAMSNAEQSELTIQEIMERVTSGDIFQFGELHHAYTADEMQELKELYRSDINAYWSKKEDIDRKKRKLVESDLIAIDIDNDAGNVDPQELIAFTAPTSYYFTFSHQTISDHSKLKQNALRLIFALDKPVSADMVKWIEERLKAEITRKFPEITLYKGEVEGTSAKPFIFGSINKNYYIFDNYLNVDELEADYRFSKELKELAELAKITYRANAIQEHELIEMAQFLANKGITLDFNKWQALAVGVWHSAQEGQYSEETALNILRTFDRQQQDDQFYMSYKRDADVANPATVGTFIKLANDNGFERNHITKLYREDTQKPAIPSEQIEIESHISAETMLNVLNSSDKNVLIDAPTGSGKTTALINALKTYLQANPDAYAYIAVPTKALANQLAKIHGLGSALTENVKVKKAMRESFNLNKINLNVGVYDKTAYFMNEVGDNPVIVVADEAHKEVLDYGYRRKAIKMLFDLRNDARVLKFVALSGTPDEIDLTKYDKQYIVSKRDDAPIFDEFQIAIYQESKLFLNAITKAIATEIERGQKVLAFINNKGQIATVQEALKAQGYKVCTITSNSANLSYSNHYRKLLNEEKFPDCDVLIATNVIADGINILNENDNYTCLIAPHFKNSPLFNVSTIKQATNRFRNKYKRVLMPLFFANRAKGETKDEVLENFKKRVSQTALYGLENEYHALLQQAEKVAGITQSRFKNDITLYQPSMLERVNGLVFQNHYHKDKIRPRFNFEKALEVETRCAQGYKIKDHEKPLIEELNYIRERLFSVDERSIRKKASDAQESYYKYFYNAFVHAVETILQCRATRLTMQEYLNGTTIDTAEITKFLEGLAKRAMEDEKEKAERVAETLTEDIFTILQTEYAMNNNSIRDDSEAWQAVSLALTKRHANTLKDILPFCDCGQAIKVLEATSDDGKIHRLKNSLEAIDTIENYSKATVNTLTKTLLDVMWKNLEDGDKVTSGQLDEFFAVLAKKLKLKTVKKTDVSKLYNLYFRCEESRPYINGKQTRIKENHRFVKLDDIAQEYGFTNQEMTEIFKRYKYENRINF